MVESSRCTLKCVALLMCVMNCHNNKGNNVGINGEILQFLLLKKAQIPCRLLIAGGPLRFEITVQQYSSSTGSFFITKILNDWKRYATTIFIISVWIEL